MLKPRTLGCDMEGQRHPRALRSVWMATGGGHRAPHPGEKDRPWKVTRSTTTGGNAYYRKMLKLVGFSQVGDACSFFVASRFSGVRPLIRNETFREVVHHAHKPDAYHSAKDEVLTMSMDLSSQHESAQRSWRPPCFGKRTPARRSTTPAALPRRRFRGHRRRHRRRPRHHRRGPRQG